MFVQGRRAAAALALALAALAGLSGCSSGGDPRTLPPITQTPTSTTTTAPPLDEKTALAEASAIVREYFRLINSLSRDMSASGFALLETEACPCRKFLRSLREVSRKHQHYFGHATVTAVTPAMDSADRVQVLVSYDSTRGGIRSAKGSVVTQSAGRRGVTELFYMLRVNNSWLIDKIAVVREGTKR